MQLVNAEVITIGDELLLGQVVDTNAAFLGQQLTKVGLSVVQVTTIPDELDRITSALSLAQKRAKVVIVTGGLGPTKDDVTKNAFCTFFNDTLITNSEVRNHIIELFENLYQKQPDVLNISQAEVPSLATVLKNEHGTAPGMFFEKESTLFFSLPGVPFEMKALFTNSVLPIIQQQLRLPVILYKTLLTEGVGESQLALQISDFENQLPSHISLAYLPSSNSVRLRLTGNGTEKLRLEKELNEYFCTLENVLKSYAVGIDLDSVESTLVALLQSKNKTLSVAESCTGGLIASSLTKIPGVSSVFKGSVVTYQTETKTNILGVTKATIEENSVVSDKVAIEMALAAQKQFQSDYAIATTGNAGPTKGDADAEIGTVFIAVASPSSVSVKKFLLGTDRHKVLYKAKNKSLQLLRQQIQGES